MSALLRGRKEYEDHKEHNLPECMHADTDSTEDMEATLWLFVTLLQVNILSVSREYNDNSLPARSL